MKRTSVARWLFLALVLFVVLRFLLYPAVSNRLRFHNNTGKIITQWNQTPSGIDESENNRLHTQYRKTLSQIAKHDFQSGDTFKKIGPPLSSILKEDTDKKSLPKVKRILAWTSFFGNKDWVPKTICSGDYSCVGTSDKKDLAISDGLVVHPRDLGGKANLPATLLPHQRLIYLIQESPFSTGIDVGEYGGVFNWTSTYRMDSDSPFPFLNIKPRKTVMPDTEFNQLLTEIQRSKKRVIAYMNSNCHAAHTMRLDFIAKLKGYIAVDMYGSCGNLKCPRFTEECTKTMSQYKFYLALENSHCRDYITEKITQPLLEWNAVPVVMGGADPSDYERILPPNSYIHTSGFKNPRDLVEYLLLLDKNPILYAKYHEWRRTHWADQDSLWCNICKRLHNTSLPVQTYTDFKGWYRQDTCLP